MPPQHTERIENLELQVPILVNPVINNSNMVDIRHALVISSKRIPLKKYEVMKNHPKEALSVKDTDSLVMPIVIGSTILNATV